MNPNLVPTPRTDKNGWIVMRHMKPQPDASTSAKAIPPVVSDPDQKRRALIEKTLVKAPAEMVTLVERLTTTGTATAREWVLRPIAEYRVGQITSKKFGHITTSDETPEEVMINMLELWNAGNVAEETGRVGEVDFTKEGDFVYLEHSVRETLTDNQWRGYAALRLGLEPLLEQDIKFEYGDVDEFINWAGEQDDINTVISFARERRTMNVSVLSGLVTAFTASAMREGAL
jgi:hypothetical protein